MAYHKNKPLSSAKKGKGKEMECQNYKNIS
jgi:hypothetical protein